MQLRLHCSKLAIISSSKFEQRHGESFSSHLLASALFLARLIPSPFIPTCCSPANDDSHCALDKSYKSFGRLSRQCQQLTNKLSLHPEHDRFPSCLFASFLSFATSRYFSLLLLLLLLLSPPARLCCEKPVLIVASHL